MFALLLTLIVAYFLLWAAAEAYNEYVGYTVFRPLTPARLGDHVRRWWLIFKAWLFWRRQP